MQTSWLGQSARAAIQSIKLFGVFFPIVFFSYSVMWVTWFCVWSVISGMQGIYIFQLPFIYHGLEMTPLSSTC